MTTSLTLILPVLLFQADGPPLDTVKFCCPHSENDLRLYGFELEVPRPTGSSSMFGNASNVETMLDNGDSANRLDLVFVCDGFTAADLASWPAITSNGYERLFDYEPFTTYRNYFNVHRVDVISNESGVDNDPTEGIQRDTALDMGFFCGNIERLLCVNVNKAWEQAQFAPDADQVVAVANSTKYGGAGYSTSDVGTYAGLNSVAVEIFIHELGHSLGDLADEYDYADGTVYSGPEFSSANASIMSQDQMSGSNLKWDDWIGSNLAGVGPHGCYEGCSYSEFGAFRPSSNSMMRSLAQPFNSPSREQLIFSIYQIVSPIDSVEPSSASISSTAVAKVFTPELVGSALRTRWYLDGVEIPGAVLKTLDLSQIDVAGADMLTVRVWDPTPMVRNEALRESLMTAELTWTIEGNPADVNGDGSVDGIDLSIVLGFWGLSADIADINNDGIVDGVDLSIILGAWG